MEVVLLVGMPGSGKTTFCKACLPGHTRLSQDDGPRKRAGFMRAYLEALDRGVDVVVDRMSPSRDERQRFIAPARAHGYTVRIVYFDVPTYVCAMRVKTRGDHPTIKCPEDFRVAAGWFRKALQVPTADECDQLEAGDPLMTNERSLQLALHLAKEKCPWR